ncbi:MAG TPA: hypothetical protein VE398_11235 [Acidobacteriota bacterium]|nr:hypothetical protein [Acidobacteriota bacterium]
MSSDAPGRFHAGDSLEDLCRVCKTVRAHTVIVADSEGRALRVICDYCGSQHNYRGGEPPGRTTNQPARVQLANAPVATVTERERRFGMVTLTAQDGGALDLELLLRRVIREETGLTPVPMAEKWRGGEMILRPGKAGLQEKGWPIETFFHKVVMLRNRLRVLEQQINGAEIPEDLKVKLQSYITGCYGTLTSFNVLFAEEEDRFHGISGQD